MAFLPEPSGLPVPAKELTGERLGLLSGLRPELQDSRLLFRGPGLGTKEVRTPFFTSGLNADGLASGLLLSLCEPSGNSGSSNLPLPFLHSLRALSTVSFAHGSGGFSEGEGPAEAIAAAGQVEASAPRSGGAILMVTGLPTARGCRRDQTVRLT